MFEGLIVDVMSWDSPFIRAISDVTVGRTDELGYNVVEDPVDVHDLHATMLRLLGVDHEKLTYKFQGRDFRLTDVHGKIVSKLIG